MKMKIILASASPRRKSLLKQIGWDFSVMVSTVEERVTSTVPEEVVMELSRQKALDVFSFLRENRHTRTGSVMNSMGDQGVIPDGNTEAYLVIGADTIVASGELILGKPTDEEAAMEMLSLLQGGSHQVYTGVTLCYHAPVGDKTVTFYEATRVSFYPMTREEILSYVAGGEPMDKAGAYGIQGEGARYIRMIEGDYNNVVGLPVGRVYQEVRKWGIPV